MIPMGSDGGMNQVGSGERASDSGHTLKGRITRFTGKSGCR